MCCPVEIVSTYIDCIEAFFLGGECLLKMLGCDIAAHDSEQLNFCLSHRYMEVPYGMAIP